MAGTHMIAFAVLYLLFQQSYDNTTNMLMHRRIFQTFKSGSNTIANVKLKKLPLDSLRTALSNVRARF